jgi:drug/metabolite transporter (DMT)-like permease
MSSAAGAVRSGRAAGILLIVGAVFTMALQDAVVKLVSAELPLWQLFVLRSLIALPLLATLVPLLLGGGRLLPRAPGWALLRGALLVAMYVAFYAGLPVLPLSLVAAAYYTGPLFIVLFAALFLGERVGRRETLAVLIGFAGVLVVLQPGTGAFDPAMLVPIAAAVCYALANVMSRGKCAGESALALSVALNLCFVLGGGAMTVLLAVAPLPTEATTANPFLLGGWVALGAGDWAMLGGLAVANLVIHLALAKAYQSAPAQAIAPFDYSYLVFAAIWGFLLFAEIPTVATLLGMAMIAGAGLLVALGRPKAGRP